MVFKSVHSTGFFTAVFRALGTRWQIRAAGLIALQRVQGDA